MNCRQKEREGLCTLRKCRSAPCHAAAQTTLEQMNPFHPPLWQLPHGGPRKEAGAGVAAGLRYEVRGEENDRTENGRWWKGVTRWAALMVSEGYGTRQLKARGSGRKTS